ncbi:MAG: type III polyketide synthase [Solirubrobacteraceae bacterium]|nr:type III polyketide synthase [Solirubrobacteraceae bacterium]
MTERPVQTVATAPVVRERRRAHRRRERTAVLRGLSTGGPRHEVTQAQVKVAATSEFGVHRSDSLLDVFDNAQIDTRRFAQPVEWYLQPRSFAEKNAVYVTQALDLAERLAREALQDAGIEAADVDAVVFVSSTGISTPSLDAALIQRMGIDLGAIRVPLWGLGCSGGAGGLARAADLVRAGYEHVLLVAVEFCSLTFVLGDESKSNFIGTALFGDGGAAAVLSAHGAGPDGGGLMRVLHTHSALLPDTADMTGWDVVEDGFKLRLSKEIPALMAGRLRGIVDESLAVAGWSIGDVGTVVIHPGGAKVIEGYQAALELDEHALDTTRSVLRSWGNMSSPTVLFVLAEALRAKPQGRGLISASGPGFSVEHLLVEFP